jgi:hypothetical protein
VFIPCWGEGEKGICQILTKKWNELQKGESFESFGKLRRKEGFTYLINQKVMYFIKKRNLKCYLAK